MFRDFQRANNWLVTVHCNIIIDKSGETSIVLVCAHTRAHTQRVSVALSAAATSGKAHRLWECRDISR